jgi:hypothetical protein
MSDVTRGDAVRAEDGGRSRDRQDDRDGRDSADEDVVRFSRKVLGITLRPYQGLVAKAVADSVVNGRGATFSVMMARQMGKNELSAVLEAWLLERHAAHGGTIVKAAPTFRPQIINSMQRLERLLRRPRFARRWKREHGHQIALDEARILFFSAEPEANVVGATASLLLEIDEAQHVDAEKFTRDFRPMCASTNATTVLYGTAWTDDTLLERQKQANLEEFHRAGTQGSQCHFEFDWRVGAAENPAYKRFVEGEMARLGEAHPLFRTQYRLECLAGGGGFFTPEQRLLLRGTHARCQEPRPLPEGTRYVAALDVAGAAEEDADASLRALQPRKDGTVVGIAEVTPGEDGELAETRLVEIYWWTGRPLHEQCARLIRLLRDTWGCAKVVVDATGLGADLAARLQRALGPAVVEPFVFSVASKSRLAYHLQSHVNSGQLQMWAEPHLLTLSPLCGEGERSAEAAEFWYEMERVRPVVRAGNHLGFAVPEHQGHDDVVSMLALLSWAARDIIPAPARAMLLPDVPNYDQYGSRYGR